MIFCEIVLNWILNWIIFWWNSNIELNQFGYRSPLFPVNWSPNEQDHITYQPLPSGVFSIGQQKWLEKTLQDLKTVPFFYCFLFLTIASGAPPPAADSVISGSNDAKKGKLVDVGWQLRSKLDKLDSWHSRVISSGCCGTSFSTSAHLKPAPSGRTN